MVAMHGMLLLAQADGSPFHFLERNSHVIYPALGGLVLVLLAAAVLSAWRTPKIAGVEKAKVKGEIIRAMRSHIGWITANELAERLDLDTHVVAMMMTEMKDDGVLTSAMLENLVHYRLRGT